MADARLSWLTSGATVQSIVRRLTREFDDRGFWGASQDARALVGHATGLDFTGLVVHGDRRVTADERDAVERLARRRLAFEPVGRILASRDFMGFDLEVSPATLEPREDTEVLVECALDALPVNRPAVVVDIGTGTGAILIAILAARPASSGIAIDISAEALATATRNAVRHGVGDRWTGVVASYAAALQSASCDLIVSNPPYIATAEIAGLEPDVRDYDPHLALDGGADGLDAYRVLVPQGGAALKSGGSLLVEIGATQAADVRAVMEMAGLTEIAVVLDRAGRDRVVSGKKP